MNTVVLSTANAKTDKNNVLRLNLTTNLKLENNLISLNHLNIYYNWKNFKAEYGNTAFEYTHVRSNIIYKVRIPDGSYSVSDLNNFIHHNMQANKFENADGSFDINIYPNNVYNRVTITVSNDFILNLSDGLMTTLGFDSSQKNITNTEINGNLVPKLERVESVQVLCNLVDNRVTHDSSVLYTFTPDKAFGSLLTIKPYFKESVYCRNATFNYIEIQFMDQDGRDLSVEDNILVRLGVIDAK